MAKVQPEHKLAELDWEDLMQVDDLAWEELIVHRDEVPCNDVAVDGLGDEEDTPCHAGADLASGAFQEHNALANEQEELTWDLEGNRYRLDGHSQAANNHVDERHGVGNLEVVTYDEHRVEHRPLANE